MKRDDKGETMKRQYNNDDDDGSESKDSNNETKQNSRSYENRQI